jgi:hypothetical protein
VRRECRLSDERDEGESSGGGRVSMAAAIGDVEWCGWFGDDDDAIDEAGGERTRHKRKAEGRRDADADADAGKFNLASAVSVPFLCVAESACEAWVRPLRQAEEERRLRRVRVKCSDEMTRCAFGETSM